MMWHHDVCREIECVVATSRHVSGAAYFGSGASSEIDPFSDIDLVVGCSATESYQFLRRLHAALPFVLFRPFSEDREPGGRYWFAGVNPFARLDVSFYEPSELEAVLRKGRGYAQPPFRRIEAVSMAAVPRRAGELPRWGELDHKFAGALRRLHESAKATARNRAPQVSVAEAEAKLLAFRGKGVRTEAWDLYDQTLEVMAVRGREEESSRRR